MDHISSVEDTWLDRLYVHCQSLFDTTHIPSHDETHHARVWSMAKELIQEIEKSGSTFTHNDVEKLILAIFFHDVGLTVTLDEKHGLASRKICEEYFDRHQSDRPKKLDEVLDAIEHHDDKAYKNRVYSGSERTSTLAMLCVCDDLDAFEYIGVLRYAEIYLLRGITEEELPVRVIDNLKNRYEHFTLAFQELKRFHKYHTDRYNITKSFYEDLVKGEQGPQTVIALLKEHVIQEKKPFAHLIAVSQKSTGNQAAQDFFYNVSQTS